MAEKIMRVSGRVTPDRMKFEARYGGKTYTKFEKLRPPGDPEAMCELIERSLEEMKLWLMRCEKSG